MLLNRYIRLAADQVVKRANFEAKIEILNANLDVAIEQSRKAKIEGDTKQSEWRAIWQLLAIETGTPREMKQWILRVEKLLAEHQSMNALASQVLTLVKNCETHNHSVSLQIDKFDKSTDLRAMNLEAKITLCEQRVEQEENAFLHKRQLEQSLNNAKNRIRKLREEIRSVDSDQSKWTEEWSEAIEGLGVKPGAHPELAVTTLEQLELFFDKIEKSEEQRKRIFGIDQVTQKFERKVYEFVDNLGIKRNGQNANTVAAQLNRDLSAAREARASHSKIEVHRIAIVQAIEEADITIAAAKDQLRSLRAQANVQTDENLKLAGENSRRKRELQSRFETITKELLRNGDGLSIEELLKEAAGLDIDILEGELDKVLNELNELKLTRDTLRDQRQSLQHEIESKDGNAVAALASQDAEQYLAIILSGVEHYLRLRIAELILEQRIEEYRKKNQAPLLSVAGELFSRMTIRSYKCLRVEMEDSGRPKLLGIRENDNEVHVDEMSDGTRDQLYLALRLATLKLHITKGEPVPIIVDDILIGFDDDRTRACLEILAEMAAYTQVLLFTHHRRVLEIADSLNPNLGIYKHALVQD